MAVKVRSERILSHCVIIELISLMVIPCPKSILFLIGPGISISAPFRDDVADKDGLVNMDDDDFASSDGS